MNLRWFIQWLLALDVCSIYAMIWLRVLCFRGLNEGGKEGGMEGRREGGKEEEVWIKEGLTGKDNVQFGKDEYKIRKIK